MYKILYQAVKNGFSLYKYHILCWSIFIVYEILISGILIGHFESFWYYSGFYILNIILFYIHAKIVLPKSLKGKPSQYWYLPLFLILEVVVYCLLSVILSNAILILSKGVKIPLISFKLKYFIATLWRAIYFMLYGSAYYFFLQYLRNITLNAKRQIEFEKLKNQLLQTKKDFLRAQINPHIIFNTLNFVKFAAKNEPLNADEAIKRLSSIMRFALEDNISEVISIKRELEQVENLIALNQLRYDNRVELNYKKDIEDENVPVMSLCVISLVENIFKHGYLFSKELPVTIKLKCNSQCFQFQSSNLPGDFVPDTSNRTGLKNIAARLSSIYPQCHEFSYGMVEELYCVDLKIRFQNPLS